MKPPASSVSDRLVDGYAALLSRTPFAAPTAKELCLFCGLHRASFYRHFESIEDLDQRFLALILRRCRYDERWAPASRTEVEDLYESYVDLMVEVGDFFRQLWFRSELLTYRVQWIHLVIDHFLFRFQAVIPWKDGGLWAMHFDLNLSVFESYLRIATTGASGLPLREISRFYSDLLLAAYQQVFRAARNDPEPRTPEFERLLGRFAELVGRKD